MGTHLNVSHDAPTPVGMKVWAEAEITAVSENGKMIDFAVKAWDEKGPIGAGTHTRAIITNDRFLTRAMPSWIPDPSLSRNSGRPKIRAACFFDNR